MTAPGFIYLASPYSHPDLNVMIERWDKACRAAAHIIERDRRSVFCPVAHSHPLSLYMSPEACRDHDLWMAVDLPILRHAEKLLVLMLEDWRSSRGIADEVACALDCLVPIEFINPVDWGIEP